MPSCSVASGSAALSAFHAFKCKVFITKKERGTGIIVPGFPPDLSIFKNKSLMVIVLVNDLTLSLPADRLPKDTELESD